jgi:hypothetical protein
VTLTQILADLYRRLSYSSSPATEIATRLTAFVNETLQEILSEPGLAAWIARNEPNPTFASVANRAAYAVPLALDRVDFLTEHTNQRRLTAKSMDWYRATYPDPTAITGTPDAFVPTGFQAVSVQPTAATGIWGVSTSAADTTQSVKVETVRTGGVPFSSALTLNGLTRVQLGTATDHEQVTKFYVSAVGAGDIKLFDAAASGNELGKIPIGLTFARYYAFLLAPTPAAAITYYVEGERPLPDMANGTDEPPFPARFHRVLIDGALCREYELKDDTRAARARQRYEHSVSQLRYFVTCPPSFLPVAGSMTTDSNRLGANYPNGAGID